MNKSPIDLMMEYSLCLEDSSLPRLDSLPESSNETLKHNRNAPFVDTTNNTFIMSNSDLDTSDFCLNDVDDDVDEANMVKFDQGYMSNKTESYDLTNNDCLLDSAKLNEDKINNNNNNNNGYIDSETVKNKISSMWNNFKYGK